MKTKRIIWILAIISGIIINGWCKENKLKSGQILRDIKVDYVILDESKKSWEEIIVPELEKKLWQKLIILSKDIPGFGYRYSDILKKLGRKKIILEKDKNEMLKEKKLLKDYKKNLIKIAKHKIYSNFWQHLLTSLRLICAGQLMKVQSFFFYFNKKRWFEIAPVEITGVINLSFLPNIKIYDISVTFGGCMFLYDRCILGVNIKTKKIYKLWKLSEFNAMIKEANIWIDSKEKALEYLKVICGLPFNGLPHPIYFVSSVDDFINLEEFCGFILPRNMSMDFLLNLPNSIFDFSKFKGKSEQLWRKLKSSLLEGGEISKYLRVCHLLKFKNMIKPPVIKECNKGGYKIEVYAYSMEDFILSYERCLTKYKFKIYKNGEIKVNKRKLIRILPEVRVFYYLFPSFKTEFL